MAGLEGDLFVRKATLEYEGSARYDEQLEVGIRCGRIGTSSMTVQATVFRGAQRLVHGELVYVFADPATQTSRPLPQRLREVLLGFEAGEPVLVLVEGSEAPGAGALTDEEGTLLLPPAQPAAEGSWHVAAHNRLGLTVARGRLQPVQAGVAVLDHLVVRPSLQGSGIGRTMLSALAHAATARGAARLQVDAPAGAVPFFTRAGFEPVSSPGDAGAEGGVRLQRRL
jgi:GNAT superfamily N-acetyltransferase